MWVRTTRITLLVALLLAIAVLSYLASHPRLYSGHVGRLITRNLLRDTGVTFAFRDLAGNPLEAMRFYGVSLTQRGDDGSFSYLTCDSLEVAYDLRALLRREVRLSRLVLNEVQLLVRRGALEDSPSPRTRSRPTGQIPVTIAVGEIRDASVRVTSPQGESEEEIDGLVWLGSVRQDGESLRVETTVLHAEWPSRQTKIVAADGNLRLGDGTLEVLDFRAQVDSTNVHLAGSISFPEGDGPLGVDLEGDAEPAYLKDVLEILDKGSGPSLVHRGHLKVRYDGDVYLDGVGEGQIEHFPYEVDEFRATIHGDLLRFERIRCDFLGVDADVAGQVELKAEVLSLRGHGRHVDMSRPWTGENKGWPESDVDADFELRLDLHDAENIQLHLALENGEGRIFDFPVDSLATSFRYTPSVGVVLEQGRLRTRGAWLEGAGTVDPDDVVAIDVQATADTVDPWLARIGLEMQGENLVAAGRLHGTTTRTSLRVGGQVEHLAGYGFDGLDNHVLLEVESLFGDWHELQGQIMVGTLRTRGRLLGTLRTDVHRAGPRIGIPRLEVALGDTTLVAAGGVLHDESTTTVQVESMELIAGEQTWRLNQPTEVAVFEHGFSTPGIAITSDTGSFHLDGGFARDGSANLRLSVEDGDLGLLGRMALAPEHLSGLIDATVVFEGSTDAPVGNVHVALDDARLAGRALDRIELRLRADGPTLHLDTLDAEGEHGAVSLSGQGRMQPGWLREGLDDPHRWTALLERTDLDLELDVQDAHLDEWMLAHGGDRELGRASARLEVDGLALTPQISGRVSLEGFRSGVLTLPRLEVSVHADTTGLSLTDGELLAPDPWITLRGKLPVFLSAARLPRWEAERDLDLELRSVGEVDLRPVADLLPFFTRLEGTGDFVYRARGPLKSPQLEGHLRVRDGVAQMARTLEVFREIESDAEFAGDVLRVTRFVAREGENGRVNAVGEVPFKGLLPDDVWFDIDANRVLLASVPLLRAIGTSDDLKLRLERPLPDGPRVPKVTGSLLVDKAIYTGDFSEGEASTQPTVLSPTATPPWLAELRIRAQDQVRISNAALELRLQGDMDFVRDLAGPRYRGRVEIPQGRVRVLYQDFTITQGLLDFSQSTGFEPVMDIVAETEVPVYDPNTGIGRDLERVTVYLTGTLQEPVIRFTSESGYNEDTILRLLVGLGPESSDQGVAFGDIGYRVGANYLGQALASQVGGVDTIDIETQEAGLEDLGSTRIAVGKYLANNLYLRYSQGFTITERDLFLEYQISRRILFNTEVRRRLRENAAFTQFNLNLKLRFEY